MTRRPRHRRLVFRVYGFAALLSVGVMIALIVLPRYTREPKYLEPQASLLQYMVERLSIKEPDKAAAMMDRIEQRLRGRLTLFTADGQMVRTNVDPPLAGLSTQERQQLGRAKWALAFGRIVVRSDDSSLFGVYSPNRQGFPWGYILPLGAAILLIVGAASLWFTQRLARPLDQLAEAARQFGAGDTSARARLDRVDELGDVGRAFDDMAERTAAVLQAQRQLMGDVSHELRTPLARIRVALELAAEDPVAAKDVLADVGADLDEIDQLIEDILTTARLDGENVPVTRRPTRLGELAEIAAHRFATRYPHRELACTVDDPELELACDPVLLRRAVDNLLDNAAKYSDASTPIELAVAPSRVGVAFAITDHGVGMSAEELERAFTPFWRADSSRTRKTGGVGLGLALARRIARVHGGDVTLRSAPGEGTTARLEVSLAG